MKFCSDCGAEVDFRIPEGDNRPRYLCDDCGSIHYQNPRIVAGCIPEWDSRILLCRRAIAPRYGLWPLPAGFMENGETVEAAASRETEEEACAKVKLDGLYCICSIPHVHCFHSLVDFTQTIIEYQILETSMPLDSFHLELIVTIFSNPDNS